jgi:hypothetical protein
MRVNVLTILFNACTILIPIKSGTINNRQKTRGKKGTANFFNSTAQLKYFLVPKNYISRPGNGVSLLFSGTGFQKQIGKR